ncbi:Detected protein of unknown function [Hibiscus syriacus]|uniref:Disease resistance RPP13-like protein 1 n=1 Tax=Hibiscus syriacus TaxID=106335 RepID=A0A6A2YHT6_HIBSY|nr:putative disease resistance RPP13-like protein 1 [Hibiscus syriacus]KAE8677469.1 Detected protein of unknown function [Hibiscus syriacus]
MEVVSAVGEAFFSTMFEALLAKLNASDLINFTTKKKVYNELKKWEKILRGINAVLADAEEKQAKNRSVEVWLKELKETAYDVEDVLEEFSYEHSRPKSTMKNNCLRGLKWSGGRGTMFNVKMGSKITAITKKLQEITSEKNNLGLGENVGGKNYKARDYKRLPTTSVVAEVNVFGRGDEKEAILKWLLVEQASDHVQVPVLNITGMTGIGKTTLAQLVYNDREVERFFNLRAWIYVSEDFDVIKITKAILDAVKPRICDTDDLNLLQLKLKDELSGKKFLLVLDDVWHQNYDEWSLLIRPFEVENLVCKIIVTTQNQNVSQITGLLYPVFPLKELADNDCLSILACHTLGSKNFEGHQYLEGISNDILKKCKGLPSAVKALAGVLRNKPTYKEWEAVSRSNLWDLTEEKGVIVAALGLSYHHLSSHLKPCFSYCSLIPKGYELDSDVLVLLWIAEGFVQPKGSKQPEDSGREYFSDLLSRSYFKQSKKNKSLFVMHDLFIDFAQSVAGDFCFNMEHGQHITVGQRHFEMARHVSFIPRRYDVSQRFEIFNNMKHVRSFLALPTSYQRGYCYLSSKVSQELLPKLKCLRVLSLSGYFIEELSSSIGELKHLRSLNLSRTAIRLLPRSIGSLYQLQMLILNQCKELTALPVEICELSKLTRLDISDTPKLQELPPGLGNLTSLRILPKFIVGKAGGPSLRELKDLSLQGHLSIMGLHNVVDIQDSRIANLRQKHGLKELALKWSNDCKKRENQMQVLESLQPPKDLQRLSISYYRATKFPSWVGNPSFAKIEQIDLFDCMNCKSLPSLGQLPSLRSLNVRGMHAVTKLGPEFFRNGFQSLEILRFENMSEWKEWISSVGDTEVFPCLRELILHNCPRLAGTLPRTLGSLVKLDVQNCPRLTISPLSFPFLGELTMEDSSSMILRSIVGQNITSLKIKGISDLTCIIEELSKALMKLEVLQIEGCSELTCLWRNGAELQNLNRLKSLAVKKCPKLVSLVGEERGQGLCCLSSLTNLRIDSCQNFVSLPAKGLPCTMKCLTIHDCKAMGSLPDMNGCNLEELEIMGCPSLVSFPKGKLPLTLESLRIENCRNLQCLPDGIVLNLEVLRISACMNICALPNPMWNLNSLQELSLSDIVALTLIPEGGFPPNLTSLELSNCENLKQPMSEWGLDKLNSLTELKVVGTCPATDIVSFPYEGVMLPSTLKSLCLERLDNLEYLSREVENLVDLQELQIKGCRKLRYLPKTGLPVSLGRLCISGCPVLRDKCRKEKGEYWSIIRGIPCLQID